MKKTFVTTMPDSIGAFLKASKVFASLNVNITRVSYNKSVDAHTLFIDAEGSEESLDKAMEKLREIGYIRESSTDANVILLEFRLRDIPGSVTAVLELIEEYNFNISYISSQGDNTEFQLFKMGLFVSDEEKFTEFLEKAGQLCEVRLIDYNRSEKYFDNSIFYNTFASSLAMSMDLSKEDKEKLMVNINLAMQTLDEEGNSPYRTFDSIGKFAELLSVCRGESFSARISRHYITDNTEIILIEPPCGSNTAIIKSMGDCLFIDSGYACYEEEMLKIFREILPEFDSMNKKILITHADVDHCGLLHLFDEIYSSAKSRECLGLEYSGGDGYREQNPLHKPYIQICKTLTSYHKTDPERVTALWGDTTDLSETMRQVGFFSFGELEFEVYEAKGGHLKGEIILIDYLHRISFTGDVYVNTHGMTSEQKKYNSYAPILMTSVDTDPILCAKQRNAVMQRLGAGKWKIFGAHGMVKEYELEMK
ncbi:MAG: Zn-dependent hydrolase [Eubacteriaceae bacterium]|nr:Zn-dependent hydrolase [Eubacteriaceae bacterium]